MRSDHTVASTQVHFSARASPPCLEPFSTDNGCLCFSMTLHIHLPGLLRSTGITPLHHYYEASDPARLSPPLRSPCLTHPDFPPFCLQPPHESRDGFLMLPLSLTGVSVPLTGTSIRASPFASRLANFIRPNRVRSPTDWRFSSSCFPPRLTATQLLSDTDRRASV